VISWFQAFVFHKRVNAYRYSKVSYVLDTEDIFHRKPGSGAGQGKGRGTKGKAAHKVKAEKANARFQAWLAVKEAEMPKKDEAAAAAAAKAAAAGAAPAPPPPPPPPAAAALAAVEAEEEDAQHEDEEEEEEEEGHDARDGALADEHGDEFEVGLYTLHSVDPYRALP
jgi:hypothetical protein